MVIPFSIVEAGNTSETKHNKENFFLEIGTLDSEGLFNFEKIFLSENDLFELEGILGKLIDNIISNKEHKSLEDMIDGILGRNNPVSYRISKTLREFKLSRTRSFIASSGHGLNFDFLQKNSLKIRKKLTFWHYTNNNGLFKDKTIIIQPLALKTNILRGKQFGFMTGFTGIYLNLYRGFAKESYTFFMGTAKHARGFDISSYDTTIPTKP